jgi:hypothetical protein
MAVSYISVSKDVWNKKKRIFPAKKKKKDVRHYSSRMESP